MTLSNGAADELVEGRVPKLIRRMRLRNTRQRKPFFMEILLERLDGNEVVRKIGALPLEVNVFGSVRRGGRGTR